MKLFERLFQTRDIDHENFDLALFEETKSSSGINVTVDKALSISAVYSAISLSSETIAVMPVHAMRKRGDGREAVDPQPAWLDPARGQPNPDQDRFGFFSRLLVSRYTHGNAYVLVTDRDRYEFPTEMYPIHPDHCRPVRRNGRVMFELADGSVRSKLTADYPQGDIIHIKGFDTGGLEGVSPIRREAIGLGLAQEQYASKFFSQGARADGIIETDHRLDEDQVKGLRSSWNDAHRNSRTVGILTSGAKWKQTQIPNDDAQFLESRKFTLAEIARMFKVPPHLIADMERSTSWGSGIEEQNRMWLIIGLLPEITRLEHAFTPCLPPGQFLRFNPTGLLRGDTKNRYDSYAVAIQNGWMTRDEVRSLEDMSSAGLDQYLRPMNIGNSESLDNRGLAETAGTFIRAGFDPEAVASYLGIDIEHTGSLPITIQQPADTTPASDGDLA